MFPNNSYKKLVETKLDNLNLSSFKRFNYNPNPEVLTGEIEILTNYSQRKKNLELRKKIFEDKDDEQSIKELEKLEQLYTLGGVNFDSVIIIDFGNSLKSVLTSLIYTDVNQNEVLLRFEHRHVLLQRGSGRIPTACVVIATKVFTNH